MAFIRKILLATLVLGAILGILIFGAVYFIFTPSNTATPQPIEEGPAVEEFIGEIAEIARKLGADNDLYASVMIAQAILESNSGQSGLATAPNYNLFGIKGQHQNNSVLLETLEDDGAGNMTTIQAEFRKYASYEDSLKDYVNLLRNGVSWNKHYYTSVFKSNTTSYKDATQFLTGSYATDSKYYEKLNALIAQYDLAQYDKPIQNKKTIQVEDGDSLPLIAEANEVSVTSIMQWNQLSSNFIEAGQTLTIYY
ncbi:glucosaminidase domain-containing protein [Solibacillus sp. FSL K6-1523]|uniref:glucosaminidase domain-containing protein n=1 Tax=Solibacillus sp. FSL K6-1523 TaxID=2921471 RepID=UPI0030FBE17F